MKRLILIKRYTLLIFGLMIIVAPDTFLFLVHLVFELVETGLDHLIEHLLHTERYTTQIIVFYLMFSMALWLSYALLCNFRQQINSMLFVYPAWRKATLEKAKIYWERQPVVEKLKLISGCLLSIMGFSSLMF
jgi:hypothetical protein